MKKKYQTPRMEMMVVEPQQALLKGSIQSGGGQGGSNGTGSNGVTEGEANQRGDWGDMWN